MKWCLMTTKDPKKAVKAAPAWLEYTDLVDEFKGHKSLVKFNDMTLDLHQANKQRNQAAGAPKVLVYHWLATDFDSIYDDYRFNVPYSVASTRAAVVRTLSWKEKEQHLWGRNGNTTAVGICGMYDHRYKLQDDQLEEAAIIGAEVCAWKVIDPNGSSQLPELRRSGESLIPTGRMIWVPNVTDHAFFAKKDGYPNDRIDVGPYLPIIKNRLLEVYRELKAGKRQFKYKELLV